MNPKTREMRIRFFQRTIADLEVAIKKTDEEYHRLGSPMPVSDGNGGFYISEAYCEREELTEKIRKAERILAELQAQQN